MIPETVFFSSHDAGEEGADGGDAEEAGHVEAGGHEVGEARAGQDGGRVETLSLEHAGRNLLDKLHHWHDPAAAGVVSRGDLRRVLDHGVEVGGLGDVHGGDEAVEVADEGGVGKDASQVELVGDALERLALHEPVPLGRVENLGDGIARRGALLLVGVRGRRLLGRGELALHLGDQRARLEVHRGEVRHLAAPGAAALGVGGVLRAGAHEDEGEEGQQGNAARRLHDRERWWVSGSD
mmetsp:Transcript_7319/g.18828  ORF Transcript_7319/g.18828 Transcript_7319/m.18828 type:complete len:238 (-) Transcript_7319:85-798(-)